MSIFYPELSLFRRNIGSLFDDFERGMGMGMRGMFPHHHHLPLDVDYLPLTGDTTTGDQQDNTTATGSSTGKGGETQEMKRGESGESGERRQGHTSGDSTAMTQADPGRQSLIRGSPFGSLIRAGTGGDMGIGIKLNVQEDANNMNIIAELPPSVKKSDVNINVRGNVLSIQAEKRNERKEEDKDKKYLLQEISYGSTSRTIRLPNYVDMNKLEAKFDEKDGKLKITVPKKEESKNIEKKVEIQ